MGACGPGKLKRALAQAPAAVLQGRKLWYRGGCYKFAQSLILLCLWIGWMVAASLFTHFALAASPALPHAVRRPMRPLRQHPALLAHPSLFFAGLKAPLVAPCSLPARPPACLQGYRLAVWVMAWVLMACFCIQLVLRLIQRGGMGRRRELEDIEAEHPSKHSHLEETAHVGWGGKVIVDRPPRDPM